MANANRIININSRPVTATSKVSAGGILKNKGRNLKSLYQSSKNLVAPDKRFKMFMNASSKLQEHLKKNEKIDY